ncbi:Spy0128 family protein, partial [Bifidobacterium gallicum]
ASTGGGGCQEAVSTQRAMMSMRSQAARAGGASDGVVFVDGKATVTLHKDDVVTMSNVPAGASYSIRQNTSVMPTWYTQRSAEHVDGIIAADGRHEALVTNEYHTSGSWTPTAHKEFINGTLTARQFEFELLENGSAIAATSNDADGNVQFTTIEYTSPGKHTYIIREKDGGNPFIVYDTADYEITVTLTDNGQGQLTATVNNAITITNRMMGPLPQTGGVPNRNPMIIGLAFMMMGLLMAYSTAAYVRRYRW